MVHAMSDMNNICHSRTYKRILPIENNTYKTNGSSRETAKIFRYIMAYGGKMLTHLYSTKYIGIKNEYY